MRPGRGIGNTRNADKIKVSAATYFFPFVRYDENLRCAAYFTDANEDSV